MAYTMKGFSGFGNSPLTKKAGPETKKFNIDEMMEEDFLMNQNESKVKSTDYLHKTPSTIASDAAKEDYNEGGPNVNEEEESKEIPIINKYPKTRPPHISDIETHLKVKKKLN